VIPGCCCINTAITTAAQQWHDVLWCAVCLLLLLFRFLDKGLDEVGPKGLDFMTVLAAHEGEGLVVDR